MKKLSALLISAIIIVSFAACGEKATETPASTPAATESTTEATETSEVKGLEAPIAEQPILLTSVGQSAEVEMVKVMLEKQGLTTSINALATSADIGDNKTLVLAVGGSSKGLGAAGIDADQEIARAKELITAADEKGLSIIVVHMGGEARRGELSDKFIEPAFEKADYAIVTADGNKDGLMKTLAGTYGVAFDEVSSMSEISAPLKNAFK